MQRCLFSLLIAVLAATTGCSTTPGDAAVRARHPEVAAKLYAEGAEQGDALAALKLGLLVDAGRVNGFGSAATWFLKACQLGDEVGCHNTGVAYEYAEHGFLMDRIKAAHFYRQAAVRGYVQSQYNLGSLYSMAYLQDDAEGLKWLLVAQKRAAHCLSQPICQWIRNDPPGHVARLKQRMSSAQIEQAESAAAEWKASR